MTWPTKEWFALRERVFERDGRTCRYCGGMPIPYEQHVGWNRIRTRSGLVADHVIPRSLGGTDDIENLVTACEPCNLRKYNNIWTPLPLGGEYP